MDTDIQSANINALWLQNIYENLKKIEEFERYAREGCTSVLEYLQYPNHMRSLIVADVQYKNLRLIFNEMCLVIPDLAPVIGSTKAKELRATLDRLKLIINDRSLLVVEQFSESKRMIINGRTTEDFDTTLDILSLMREDIIELIKNILYIESKPTNSW